MRWGNFDLGRGRRHTEDSAVRLSLPQAGSVQLSTTSSYALSELQKDVEGELLCRPESERAALREATKFAIFVVHNKNKAKLADLPSDTPSVRFVSSQPS
jgi:hypothetical protein